MCVNGIPVGWTGPHGASLDWIGELPEAAPGADRALFRQRPVTRARPHVASDPKGEVMQRLREFLNDEAW
jgi:hypothetical protein